MAWSASKIFRPFLADVLDNTSALDLGSDAFKGALYDNSITPDENVTSANSAYGGAGVWTATGSGTGTAQVYQAGQWAQGGVALAGTVLNSGTSDVVFFDANDIASGAAATLANIFGLLIYDTTVSTPVANQGICFNYFGGTNAVTNGTFTAVLNVLGLSRITLT
jgi:hypothetical protein